MPVASGKSFEQAYGQIAARCLINLRRDVEDPKESVRQYLNSDAAGKWLLVVDNADDDEMLLGILGRSQGLAYYPPESKGGFTLFTSRHLGAVVSLVDSEIVKIEEMDGEDAETLLAKSIIRKEQLRDQVLTTELLTKLTCLPLAIVQAAASLNKMQVSIRDYLRPLLKSEKDAINLLSREFHDKTRSKQSERSKGSEISVAITWLVSFGQIRRSDPFAADLISFKSFIEHRAILQSILPSVEPEDEMVYAIGTLQAYASIIRRDNGDAYDMHWLVHLATKIWLREDDSIEIEPSRGYPPSRGRSIR